MSQVWEKFWIGAGKQSVMVLKPKQVDTSKLSDTSSKSNSLMLNSYNSEVGRLEFSSTTREQSLMEGCLEENTLVLDTDLMSGRVYF